MLLANSPGYRTNYTVPEETAALFTTHEADQSRGRGIVPPAREAKSPRRRCRP